MIAESCSEMIRSSSATRASRVRLRLSETTTVPSSTSLASSEMMSLARRCSASDLATLLCSTIWSSSPVSSTMVAASPAMIASAAMALLLVTGSKLLELLGVVEYVVQQVFELLVAGQLVAQVRELRTRLEQLAQRLDLPDYRLGAEVIHRLEPEFDAELAAFVADPVGDAVHGARRHAFHHLVEVVEIDVDEPAILQLRQWLLGLPAEVAQHANDERQFLLFDRVALLDVVGQLYARGAYLLQPLLDTILLGHLFRLLTMESVKRPLSCRRCSGTDWTRRPATPRASGRPPALAWLGADSPRQRACGAGATWASAPASAGRTPGCRRPSWTAGWRPAFRLPGARFPTTARRAPAGAGATRSQCGNRLRSGCRRRPGHPDPVA